MAYKNLEPAAVKALLEGKEGWKYVDVRTEEEFGAGHVAGAFNVPFAVRDAAGRMGPNPEFLSVLKKKFPADSRLVLGCAGGGRSQRACEMLSAEGYANLVNMLNGFHGSRDASGRVAGAGWQGSGYPTENDAPGDRTYAGLRSAR